MNNSEEDFSAVAKLEFLTASNPAVRRNIMRHTAAFRILLTGRKEDSADLKVLFGAGFGMSDATDIQYQSSTRADGNDRLYLRFDVDDACGPSDGLGLIRKEGDQTLLYGRCRLWSPVGVGRTVVVFEHEGCVGHFAPRPYKTLKRVDRLPAEDCMPGFLRRTRTWRSSSPPIALAWFPSRTSSCRRPRDQRTKLSHSATDSRRPTRPASCKKPRSSAVARRAACLRRRRQND